MDWEEDRWFASHHYKNLNDDFKQWWLGYYGLPEEYDDTHEYWTRCAFSLVGWNNKTASGDINQGLGDALAIVSVNGCMNGTGLPAFFLLLKTQELGGV